MEVSLYFSAKKQHVSNGQNASFKEPCQNWGLLRILINEPPEPRQRRPVCMFLMRSFGPSNRTPQAPLAPLFTVLPEWLRPCWFRAHRNHSLGLPAKEIPRFLPNTRSRSLVQRAAACANWENNAPQRPTRKELVQKSLQSSIIDPDFNSANGPKTGRIQHRHLTPPPSETTKKAGKTKNAHTHTHSLPSKRKSTCFCASPCRWMPGHTGRWDRRLERNAP